MKFIKKYDIRDKSMNRQLAIATEYRAIIDQISAEYGIPPSIVTAIGSRESRWGLALKPPGPDGTGDFSPRQYPARYREGSMPPDGLGFGRGLFQIDYDYHKFARTGGWRDPEANITYAVKLLHSYRELINSKIMNECPDPLSAAIASYNAGPGRVIYGIRNGLDIDYYTTGGDYSSDVLARAEFFRARGWG